MNAIVDSLLPENGSLFLKRPVLKKVITVNREPIVLYQLNPRCLFGFKRFFKRLSQTHEALFFTENCHRFFREIPPFPVQEYFFQHFPEILRCFSAGNVPDVAVVCDSADIRLLKVLASLKNFCVAVTLVTEDEAFFESISETAMIEYGLSLNLRLFEEVLKKELLILMSHREQAVSFRGKCIIPLCEPPFPDHPQLLVDCTADAILQSDTAFQKLPIRHCGFLKAGQPISGLTFKN